MTPAVRGAGWFRRLPRRRGDAGMTLVEVLVAAAVGSVVVAAVSTVAIGALSASKAVMTRTGTSADSRTLGEALTRSLRVAARPKGQTAAIVAATPTSVTFYALLNRSGTAQSTDTVPSYVELGWDGTCVTRRITPGVVVTNPAATGPFYTWTPSGTAVCLARTTTAPAYSYYATAVLGVNGTDSPPIGFTSGALTTADLPTVRSVQVRLTVTDPKNPGITGAPLLSRVTLTNVLTDTGGL